MQIGRSSPIFIRVPRHPEAQGLPQPTFGADLWPLHQIMMREHVGAFELDFASLPLGFRTEGKTLVYQMLNCEILTSGVTFNRPFVAARTVATIFSQLRDLARSAADRGVRSFSSLESKDLDEWALSVAARSDINWSTKEAKLQSVTRAWAHDSDQPTSIGFTRPNWVSAVETYLGPPPRRYSNSRSPISPKDIGALMQLCISSVVRYALDEELDVATSAIERYRSWATVGAKAPPGETRAAASLVILYLTGMRPEELFHLERGCATAATHDNNSLVEIRGRHFKNVVAADATSDAMGRTRRQPWVTVELALLAVHVLERISRHNSLLMGRMFETAPYRKRLGGAVTTASVVTVAARLLQRFANGSDPRLRILANSLSTHSFGLSLFRRTLAWHIANQPDGEIALGLQYGHLHTATSMGYIGLEEDGFPEEIDTEFLHRDVASFSNLVKDIHKGSRIAGPAANRLLELISGYKSDFPTVDVTYMTKREIQRWRSSNLSQFHENRASACLCIYDPDRALCNKSSPQLNACQPTKCANVAVTDMQLGHLDNDLNALEGVASDYGKVTRRRVETNINRLRAQARWTERLLSGDSDD